MGLIIMNGDESKKEFGDYQTPDFFSLDVCKYLRDILGINPQIIIEPTCGIGNFVNSSLMTFSEVKKAYGIEINQAYCKISLERIKDNRFCVYNDNIFNFDLSRIPNDERLLIIGNPPWVTNSVLKYNLPDKENFKGLSGTDAITGSSNFDICEYIILKLINEYRNKNATIAMLCKTSVARNVYEEVNRNSVSLNYFKILNFNSSKIFGISASACLIVLSFDKSKNNVPECECYEFDEPEKIVARIEYKNGSLAQCVDGLENFEGECQLIWRQGIKHDCSSIMELKKVRVNEYINKRKEHINLEDELIFPLLKSSDFKKNIICDNFEKYVIVTQKKTREDTSYIEMAAPLTWKYLNDNIVLFNQRKSSIYNGAPAFSMFGVGDYSYSKYKVGISGFYKKPVFSLIFNKKDINKPIMLDDTTYFLSFDDYSVAYVCMLLLNSKSVQNFLHSISFKDAKRPYTKKILQRLDLLKAIEKNDFDRLKATEQKLQLNDYLTTQMVESFIAFLQTQ